MSTLRHLGSRARVAFLVVVIVVGLLIALPRLRAELFYVAVVLSGAEVDWFYELEILGTSATPVLKRLLRDDDDFTRSTAAEILGRVRDPRAVPMLMEAARDDPDPGVRRAAINALAVIGDPRATPVLEELAQTSTIALDRLRMMGQGGKEALLRCFHAHADPDWRARALSQLCQSPFDVDPVVKEEVKKAIKHAASEVRVAALRCLPELGDEEAREIIRPLLADSEVTVRVQASWALGQLGDGAGFEVAYEALMDRSLPNKLRANAAIALTTTGNPDARKILEEIYKKESSDTVKRGIRIGLRTLRAQNSQ